MCFLIELHVVAFFFFQQKKYFLVNSHVGVCAGRQMAQSLKVCFIYMNALILCLIFFYTLRIRADSSIMGSVANLLRRPPEIRPQRPAVSRLKLRRRYYNNHEFGLSHLMKLGSFIISWRQHQRVLPSK